MIYQISFIGVITKNDYDSLQIKIDLVGQEVAIDNWSNVGDSTRIILCCGYHQFTVRCVVISKCRTFDCVYHHVVCSRNECVLLLCFFRRIDTFS